MPHFCGRTHSTRLRPDSVPITGQSQEVGVPPTNEEIAALAYSYWEERGKQGGAAREDWLRAERELNRFRKAKPE